MATDNFQLSPASAEARFKLLQLRRRFNPDADDPLFRPIDADDFRKNGDNASDFSNLRKNGLVRITFPLPPQLKLIDPATNLPSSETFVDVWRMVPTVNDVALNGPDGVNPWPRGPNITGGYQLDGRLATLQDQALGAFVNHAQVHTTPPQQVLDDLASFQRVLFTNSRVRALSDAVRAGENPLPDPDPPLSALESQGKVVFERACSVCHGGPGQSTSPCRRHALSRHRYSVSAAGRCSRPGPLRLCALSGSPRAKCADVRDYPVDAVPTAWASRRGQDPSYELRSRPRAVERDRRWPAAVRRLEQVRCSRPSRDQDDRAVLPQQQRGHARRGRRSLHRALQVHQGQRATSTGAAAAGGLHRRQDVRSRSQAGGASGAPCLPAEAVASL